MDPTQSSAGEHLLAALINFVDRKGTDLAFGKLIFNISQFD